MISRLICPQCASKLVPHTVTPQGHTEWGQLGTPRWELEKWVQTADLKEDVGVNEKEMVCGLFLIHSNK